MLGIKTVFTKRHISIFIILLLMFVVSPQIFKGIAQDNHDQAQNAEDDGTYRRIHVPVLMYHYVSELPADADDIRRGLTVSPQLFREHVMYLKQQGYEPISLGELNAALNFGASLPQKPIVLSFDDGYTDHFKHVFPILRDLGYSGTFFLITGYIDESLPQYITWEQAEEMASAGMDIQPHTKTHPDLRARDYDFLVYQIIGSQESVQSHTATNGEFLAYPVGRYDDNLLGFMLNSGILRAFTTEFGAWHTTDNRFTMPRLRIGGEMSVAGLAQLLSQAR